MKSAKKYPICLALDGMQLDAAKDLAYKLGPRCYELKINDLYDSLGAHAVMALRQAGRCGLWVDLKIHDSPNTAANRAERQAECGATTITVHALGGVSMMKAVVDRLAKGYPHVRVLAVTLLTSQSAEDIAGMYRNGEMPNIVVLNLARRAKEAGVHGIICSPQEVKMLSMQTDLQGMQFVTPCVRSVGADIGDQKRIGTPKQALDDGVTNIVVGQQVTEAADPVAAFDAIVAEITFGERGHPGEQRGTETMTPSKPSMRTAHSDTAGIGSLPVS